MPRSVTKAASTLRRKAFRRLCHLASQKSEVRMKRSSQTSSPPSRLLLPSFKTAAQDGHDEAILFSPDF